MVKNKKGYTLIELIVVIGIMAIAFGMTVASFDSFNTGKKANLESEKLRSAIEEVMKKTSSGDLNGDVGCKVDGNPVSNQCDSSSYTLTISSNHYNLDFECVCSGGSTIVAPTVYETKSIPTASKIVFSPSSSSYVFKKDSIISGCIDVIYNGTKHNAVSFNYPGNVSIGAGNTCP